MSAVLPITARRSWLPYGALLLVWLLLLALYADTARSIVAIWNSSETFAHGYLILPISAWLIWQRRAELQTLPARPWLPGAMLLALFGAGWLLAELADVQVVRQYMLIGLLLAPVLLLLGRDIALALAFPLLFVFLAVPFGEVFIAPLIDLTADFTVWALQQTGIPVWREGASFSLPSGNWVVAEACSGVRYLIASFTLGCLYAYLTYRSTGRRILFVLVSILVPIVANGMRAYMIVMIGHLSGMTLAVGVDHLIYGWLFFGLVMFLTYWIGSFWREDHVPVKAVVERSPRAAAVYQGTPRALALALVAAVLCGMLWPLLAQRMEQRRSNLPPVDVAHLPMAWSSSAPFTAWQPSFSAPNATLLRPMISGADRAALEVLYYEDRARGEGVIRSENKLLHDKDKRASKGPTSVRQEAIGAQRLTVRETSVVEPEGTVLVWQWYWIDGSFVHNDYLGKLLQARGQLLGHPNRSAALFALTPQGEHIEAARAVLRRMLAENAAQIEAAVRPGVGG